MPQFGWTRGMENVYYAQWCLSVIGVPCSHPLHDDIIFLPSGYDRPKVIWWIGFAKLRFSCSAHDDDMRPGDHCTGDHMIQQRSPGQMMTLSTMRWPGRAEERERGVSLERNLLAGSHACLVCPRPGRPTWPAPACVSGHCGVRSSSGTPGLDCIKHC